MTYACKQYLKTKTLLLDFLLRKFECPNQSHLKDIKTKVDPETLGQFHVIVQWPNHVIKAQLRQPCTRKLALVMSHIV